MCGCVRMTNTTIYSSFVRIVKVHIAFQKLLMILPIMTILKICGITNDDIAYNDITCNGITCNDITCNEITCNDIT